MPSVACTLSERRSRLWSATHFLSSSNPDPVPSILGEKISTKIGDNLMDFEYQTFLNHLTVYGKSYVLEMSMPNSQCSIRLMYEEEQDYDGGMKSSSVLSPQSSNGSREVTGGKELFKSKKRMKLECPAPSLDESWWFEDEEEVIDEDYKYFLDIVRIYGESTILGLADNEIVKYEEEDEEGLDVKEEDGEKVQVMQEHEKVQVKQEHGKLQIKHELKRIKVKQELEKMQVKGELEKVQVKQELENILVKQELRDDSESLEQSSVLLKDGSTSSSSISMIAAYPYMESLGHIAPSVFRNKLLDSLSSPFNQNEYEDLIFQARTRTAQVKLKHLRSDSIPYKTKKLGYSYFDHYPDLAKEVERADCYKGLDLMRGFFFWLKNLGHDGAFMPWVCQSPKFELCEDGNH